jgi:FkbM family methyltransferase
MTPQLVVYRQWEAQLSALLPKLCPPGSVFVDVGANFGYFTCLCASKIGRAGRGRVFSFEPNPACLRLLDKNLLINWSMSPVQVFRGAAGVQRTTVKLSVPRGHAANASLSIPARDADLVDVPMTRIDAFVPEDIVATYMKIDVEGHEYGALKGAAALIARSPDLRIVMEWSPEQIREAGYRIDQMLDLFEELKLTCHRLPPTIHDFDAAQSLLSRADMATIGYDNILLCRA